MISNVSGEEGKGERRAAAPSPTLLEAAIERGGLKPFFHAKVAMKTRKIVGAEALARIVTPKALAAPAPYVELAERNQRIDALTFAMARVTARHVAEFNSITALPCSINVSPISLERADFADAMAGVIGEAGLKCSQFVLELTEARPAEYAGETRACMQALRDKGFGLAVDDFGAGTSNIDRLRSFPFTEVKLDPSFIRIAMKEAFAKAAMVSCVKLAKDLGLRVVAEGVETQEMWDFMSWLGVDEAQGFLFSRPLPPADFAELLKQG
jgi:EAL domain-containing protein (putative c-di-GMP-specific phosphodiesterase class I)